MVGEAYTLRYMPAREDLNPHDVFRDPAIRSAARWRNCPAGAVLVIDSRKDARAASAGGILVTRLMVRGVGGRGDRWRLPRFGGDRGARFARPITIAPRRRPT